MGNEVRANKWYVNAFYGMSTPIRIIVRVPHKFNAPMTAMEAVFEAFDLLGWCRDGKWNEIEPELFEGGKIFVDQRGFRTDKFNTVPNYVDDDVKNPDTYFVGEGFDNGSARFPFESHLAVYKYQDMQEEIEHFDESSSYGEFDE